MTVTDTEGRLIDQFPVTGQEGAFLFLADINHLITSPDDPLLPGDILFVPVIHIPRVRQHGDDVNWIAALSAGGFGFVSAILLALTGLPEAEDKPPEDEN